MTLFYLIKTLIALQKEGLLFPTALQLTKPKTQPNLTIFRRSFSTLLFCF